jgi:acetyl-CoA C-acetyltransferase
LKTLWCLPRAIALKMRGIGASDVDEIVLGHFNAGFSAQDFTASLVLQASDDLRFTPATRVENACATGSAAVHQAVKSIQAGTSRIVLVVGVEQMTNTPGPQIGENLLRASYLREESGIEGGFAGVFGQIADGYFQRHGDQSDAPCEDRRQEPPQRRRQILTPRCGKIWAMISAVRKVKRIHAWQVRSSAPIARWCRMVPQRCLSPTPRQPCAMNKAIAFRGLAHKQDFLPLSKRDILKFEGCAEAWKAALNDAGVTLDDLSFVETHDCFTIAELIEYEAMGLTPEGKGHVALDEGWVERGGQAAGEPVWRAQGQGASDRGDRRVDACAHRDAAEWLCPRGHAAQWRKTWRHLQHGWRGCGQLCFDS